MKQQGLPLRSKPLDTQDCRDRLALLELPGLYPPTAIPLRARTLREERPWTFVGAFVNLFGYGRSGLD
jgi:hypothetical protein